MEDALINPPGAESRKSALAATESAEETQYVTEGWGLGSLGGLQRQERKKTQESADKDRNVTERPLLTLEFVHFPVVTGDFSAFSSKCKAPGRQGPHF